MGNTAMERISELEGKVAELERKLGKAHPNPERSYPNPERPYPDVDWGLTQYRCQNPECVLCRNTVPKTWTGSYGGTV
jgi:hypothetical protein